MRRLLDAWASFRALPFRVQCWVGLCLVPVNLVPYAMLGTVTGRAAALAMSAVILTNVPILLRERGMSRLLSIPHLVAWMPLCIWLAWRFWTSTPMSAVEATLAWALLLVNSVSLVFDLIDSTKWLLGDRAVAGTASQRSHP
jgi:hypothetical protein